MSKKDMDRRKKFILELMGDPIYQPMRLREISSLLRLSKEEKRELYDVLDELCEEGKLSVDRKGRYEKVKGKWKKKKDIDAATITMGSDIRVRAKTEESTLFFRPSSSKAKRKTAS